MFDELFERTKKVNEYIDTSDLLTLFDETYSLQNFVDNLEDREEAKAVYEDMKSIIQDAREVVKSWQKQLTAAKIEEIYEDLELPSLWWEGSDAWEIAYEGDSSELENYLKEIIEYGPDLKLGNK